MPRGPLRIQYASDIHLEHYKITGDTDLHPERWIQPDPTADCLVLAGDVGWPEQPSYGAFLGWCSANWPLVIVIAGNHEFYTNAGPKAYSRHEKLALLRTTAAGFPNVKFLQQDSVQVRPGVWILGATLWSWIPSDIRKYAPQMINDFRAIQATDKGQRMTVADYMKWHEQDLEWLKETMRAIQMRGEKAIIVTHHLPSYELIHEKYKDHLMNGIFASSLDEFIQETQPLAWICGHSHTANQLTIGRTQLALNPHGYPGERVETRAPTVLLELPLEDSA